MILVIDNYDSFVYNLVQYLGELGPDVQVYRNDQITVGQIRALAPEKIVLSPGPCTPNEAGVTLQVIRELGPEVPILGVCLGHQSIGQAYGGAVVPAPEVMHGKTSAIYHHGDPLFDGLPSPFTGMRYHSLLLRRGDLPDCLQVTAETADGLVMAVRHRRDPVAGVQFHPESIASEGGRQLLANFLATRRPAVLAQHV